ncbi:MAG: hypothetical protein U0169_03715 [Polyangiaceae bacterium]
MAVVLLPLLATVACPKRSSAPVEIDAAAPPTLVNVTARTDASSDARVAEWAASVDASRPSDAAIDGPGVRDARADAIVVPTSDGGGATCRLVDGPLQLPSTGPAALAMVGDVLHVVVHDKGLPRTVTFPSLPLPPKAATPHASILESPGPRVSSPPCALATPFVYCMDDSGAIARSELRAQGTPAAPAKVVAHALRGTRFAAARAGDGSILLYLASRKTTEGFVTSAWLVANEGLPVHFSEEGSGATTVDLLPRAGDYLALLVDARFSMTPVHARTFAWTGTSFRIGKDAVVFVGGSGERETRGLLGSTPRTTFGFVPIARDVNEFGVATVTISEPPKDDAPTTWSLYPGGIDPAPFAATHGLPVVVVLRTRPDGPGAESAKVLEIGSVDDSGTFTSMGIVDTRGRPRDLALVPDRHGTLWLHYTDARGSFVERRACPGAK